MAEIVKKGVIVEFDFAAMDGANLLFDVTKKFLAGLDNIPFDERIEAQHLAGGNYQGGLAEYFAVVKTKKLAAKAAKDLSAAPTSRPCVPRSRACLATTSFYSRRRARRTAA